MPRRKPIIVIQGAQWGSEAKGAATAAIGQHRGASIYVRTGTVNAGHTVYKDGAAYKMQQLPMGWVDPNAVLVIGAGAYIHPEVLFNEINMINRATGLDVRERLLIDDNCGFHDALHTHRSSESGRHHSMGATGKGCSEAVIDKIKGRGDGLPHLFKDYHIQLGHNTTPDLTDCFCDTSAYLNDQYEMGRQIVIEGTQGSHLDLHLGPYPYTTHKQTQAANWAAECGLGLGAEWEVVLVVRTCPIRVAGNSGPMPLETSWPELAVRMNHKTIGRGLGPVVEPDALSVWNDMCEAVTKEYWPELLPFALTQHRLQIYEWVASSKEACEFLSEMHKRAFDNIDMATQTELQKLFEFTTVTKKLRRVAHFHAPTVLEAIRWNRPKYLALTFLNYWEPQLSHRTQFEQDDIEDVMHNIQQGEEMLGVPIEYFNVGPFNEHFFQVPAMLRTHHPVRGSGPVL